VNFLRVGFVVSLLAAACSGYAGEEGQGDEAGQLRGIIRNLMDDNSAFAKTHKADYYKPFADGQHPRATVVTCSDSRVHTHALDQTPDGDLFMVRNIGNQISTAEGSVEYGVHHLHTPLLIIVGHSTCGAIKAARGDFSKESPAIKRELVTIKLPARNPKNDDAAEILRGIDGNVNNQVAYALKKFAHEMTEGKLTVIGAIYDFRNDMQQGQGRLVITNVNGSTDSGSILASLMKINGNGMKMDRKSSDKQAAKY